MTLIGNVITFLTFFIGGGILGLFCVVLCSAVVLLKKWRMRDGFRNYRGRQDLSELYGRRETGDDTAQHMYKMWHT